MIDPLVRFGIRIKSRATLGEIAARVNKALNCSLRKFGPPERDAPCFENTLLGMWISLTYWPYLKEGQLRTYTFVGKPELDPTDDWTDIINLSHLVVKVLKQKDSADWYIPTKEELLVEGGISPK